MEEKRCKPGCGGCNRKGCGAINVAPVQELSPEELENVTGGAVDESLPFCTVPGDCIERIGGNRCRCTYYINHDCCAFGTCTESKCTWD
ncbi:MAG: hypothetical protein MJ236_05845 [Clostridia bacterium]|nr:hypothetical protein [Clostridia bacterium]